MFSLNGFFVAFEGVFLTFKELKYQQKISVLIIKKKKYLK